MIAVRSQPRQIEALSKNPSQKVGLAEWLKVKVLSSSPSAGKKKKNKPLDIYTSAGPVHLSVRNRKAFNMGLATKNGILFPCLPLPGCGMKTHQ
jgi:hypothetical protein